MKYDFQGYATKANIKCSDGRTILQDAFKDNDGATVPLVWQHMHNDPANILGHAKLENRKDGVYAYCTFNDTPSGQNAKALVKHGDIKNLSIYANSLVQKGKEVVHGLIREVSLVLTGANPGAMIENICIEHSDGTISTDEDEAIIYSGLDFDENVSHEEKPNELEELKTYVKTLSEKNDKLESLIKHALEDKEEDEEEDDEDDEEGESNMTVEEAIETMNDEQKNVVQLLMMSTLYGDDFNKEMSKAIEEEEENSDGEDKDGKSVEDVINSMNKEQKAAMYMILNDIEKNREEMLKNIAEDIEKQEDESEEEDDEEEKKAVNHSNIYGGREDMKKNVFDNTEDAALQHSAEEIKAVFEDAKRLGSFKEACLQHSITNIDVLFPDATNLTATPELIKREDAWVPVIVNGTKHTPFSRVKSYAADITADEARARGYVKGNQKVEEVISVLKRTTNPTTIYKTQKLDRDDILDITDFDVIAFIKAEMRQMLDEEIARAVLIGDGRPIGSDDKINAECVRSVYGDVAPFVTRYTLEAGLPVMDLIDSVIRARKDYRGSGSPTLFATTDIITDMLLVKDTTGRRLYSTEAELASGLRVSKIVEVPVMEGVSRTVSNQTLDLKAIIFNPTDYTIGSTAGGQVTMFDDFDIDYNKQKYLIETRISGCLTRPKSAVIFEQVHTA